MAFCISVLQYLHDGNLLNGKNQVADDAGILKKIRSWILNFRIIIVERRAQRSAAGASDCSEWLDYNISLEAPYAREYVGSRIDKKLDDKKKQAQNSCDCWPFDSYTQETRHQGIKNNRSSDYHVIGISWNK
jgi:hypothetical protein